MPSSRLPLGVRLTYVAGAPKICSRSSSLVDRFLTLPIYDTLNMRHETVQQLLCTARMREGQQYYDSTSNKTKYTR